MSTETTSSESADDTEYVEHKYLVDGAVEAREYQTKLADAAGAQSSLVALPTGLGKTVVSLLITAYRLEDCGGGRIVFLAPTKPLVRQQANFYEEALDIASEEIEVFTGEVRPEDRERIWDEGRTLIFSTPQTMQNDLIDGTISFEDVVYLTFDECHRATGDYAYTYIAERYWQQAEDPLVTGMSASPGSDEDSILEVCENLGLKNIEVVTEDDEELTPYQETTRKRKEDIELEGVFEEIVDLLEDPYTDVLKRLKNDYGVINTRDKSKVSTNTLRKAHGTASEMADNGESAGYKAMSYLAEGRKFVEALNAIQTQGLAEFKRKFNKWEQEADAGESKAVERFMNRPEVQKAQQLAAECDDVHPKMTAARSEVVVNYMDDGQAIVFTESRRMASRLADFLSINDITAKRFVGQTNKDGDKGLTQDEQADLIDEFRDGDVDVLVATSVAEEGLDIPSVDLVLFYEPVASEIRTVQRRGRTGRQDEGRVLILVTKDSRDVGMYWAAKRREDQMKEDLKTLKDASDDLSKRLGAAQAELSMFSSSSDAAEADDDTVPSTDDIEEMREESSEDTGEADEDDAGADGDAAEDVSEGTPSVDMESEMLSIVVDKREMKAKPVKQLSKNPAVEVDTQTLDVGDYVVSDRCAVERKSIDDFHATIGGHDDRSLFEQLVEVSKNYSRSVLLIEGDIDDLYTSSGIHPNAIRGMLVTIAVNFPNLTILNARDEEETTEFLELLAKREQEENDREVNAHANKTKMTQAEQQEYIISSIAKIGPKTARRFLSHFGSVNAVLTADREQLQEVEGVGEATADQVYEMVRAEYTPADT